MDDGGGERARGEEGGEATSVSKARGRAEDGAREGGSEGCCVVLEDCPALGHRDAKVILFNGMTAHA